MPARIMIVEDNAYMRRALVQFFEDLQAFEVVSAVERAEEALEHLNGAHPPGAEAEGVDLALVDMRLSGGMSGTDLVRQLQEMRPDLSCLMYSGHGEQEYVDEALAAGAQGYMLKGSPDALPEAIQRVLAGEQYIDPQIDRSRSG
jgi:DNA-binding NarL/FixJ family response regulator